VVANVTATGARLAVDNSDDVELRTVAVTGGYAAFTGLELTAVPGALVNINFTSAPLIGVSSRDLEAAAAAPFALEMVQDPVGARTGDPLSTQPRVRVVDRFGNTVLADNSTLVSISPSAGTLFIDPEDTEEILAVTVTAGIASFSDLRFTGTPQQPFSLSFSAFGLTPVTSGTFTVTNALADRISITQQPIAGKTGDLLTQMPILTLEDFDENLAADDFSTVVTVSIDSPTAWFIDADDNMLTANPAVTAEGGVIEFTGLRIRAIPGATYKLNFTAQPAADPDTQQLGDSFNSDPSSELLFSHADPYQLTVQQSAIGGVAGDPLVTQPELQVLDRFGNPATGDNSTVVTASLASGSGGAVVSGATATASAGVVRFGPSALRIDGLPSQTYTLRFAASSQFGFNFEVTDPTEFALSRQAALSLGFTEVAYSPDLVVVPTFTSDSPGSVTWTSSTDPSVCVLELDSSNAPTGNVIVRGVGTCSLRASIARFDYEHAAGLISAYTDNEVSANLTIRKAVQEPLVISSADSVDFRGNLTLSTAGGSGTGRVTFFIAENSDCRIIGGVLIPGEAGAYCEIFARKASDPNYLVTSSDDMLITINRIAQQPLRIVNSNEVSVGDIQLLVAGGSGTGEVTFQVSAPGTAQCQIVGESTLRATQNGSCGVMATKDESTNHLSSISPEVTFSFSKSSQVVNFTSAVPPRPSPGMFYDPVAVASSGLPVTISITAGAGTACQFDAEVSTRIRFMTSGSCELTATQAGNGQFIAASTTQVLVVNALNQSITFAPLVDLKFGDPNFQLAATASSGLPVSYRVGTTFVDPACSVSSSGRVTLLRAGRCEIIASQAGNSTYLPAPDVTQMFTVAPDQAGAPHLISVSVSNSAIVAKFRAPSYLGGSTVSAYRLEATHGSGDRYVNPGCQPNGQEVTCELVGVPLNQAYTVRVAAVTAAGVGVFSSDSMPVTPGATEIAVSMLSADQVSGQLSVSWEPPTSLDGEFDSYEVFVWPLNSEQPEEPSYVEIDPTVSSVSFNITEASDEQTQTFSVFSSTPSVEAAGSYNIRVVTLTDESNEAFDSINVASGVQLGLGAPSRPRNEQLTVSDASLLAAWSPPTFDGGDEITHYTVKINGSEARIENEIGSLFIEHGELRAGQTYNILIYAHNSAGVSEPALLTHSIPAPPAPRVDPAPPEEELSPPTEPTPPEEVAPPKLPEDGTPSEGDQAEVLPPENAADESNNPESDDPTSPRPTPSPSDLLNPSDDGDGTASDLEPGPGAGRPGVGDSGATDGGDSTDDQTDRDQSQAAGGDSTDDQTDRDQSQAAGGDVQDRGALQLMLWLLVGLALTLLLRRYALRNQRQLEN
jgi:hypothetical protein